MFHLAYRSKSRTQLVDMVCVPLFPCQNSFLAFLDKIMHFQILNAKKTCQEIRKMKKVRNPFTVCTYIKSLHCTLQISYNFVNYTPIKLKKLRRFLKNIILTAWYLQLHQISSIYPFKPILHLYPPYSAP